MTAQEKLQKLIARRDDLEDKLYTEQCRQHELLNRRGWGYGMRCVNLGFSTKREDGLKLRIERMNRQISELQNG